MSPKRRNLLVAGLLTAMLLSACGKPPLVPDKPTGPVQWMKGVAIACSTKTTDPGAGLVSYQFDWGDGTQSQWSEFIEGGNAFGDTHTYIDQGTYDIKARAKNSKKASGWSDPLSVSVTVGEGSVIWSFGFTDPESVEDSADFSINTFAIGSDKTACISCRDYGAVIARKSSGSRWNFTTTELDEFTSSPAVGADGTIYVGCTNDSFYAINANGTPKWAVYTWGTVNSTPAIMSDGAVVFQTEDSMVMAVEPTGTVRWTFASKGGDASPAIGTDGTVYVGTSEGEVYALDPSNGSAKWTNPYRVSSNAINASLCLDPTRSILYVVDDGGLFVALNLADGSFNWQYSVGEAASTPVLGTDGTIYLGGGGKLWALDPGSHDKKWDYTPMTGTVSAAAVSSEGNVYFLVVPGKKKGTLMQSTDSLYAVTTAGARKWACGLGEGVSDFVVSSPKIGEEGLIYVGDGYRAWCVVGLGGPAASPWPMFQHDAASTGRAQ